MTLNTIDGVVWLCYSHQMCECQVVVQKGIGFIIMFSRVGEDVALNKVTVNLEDTQWSLSSPCCWPLAYLGPKKNLSKGNQNDSQFDEGNSCYHSMNFKNHGVILSSLRCLLDKHFTYEK